VLSVTAPSWQRRTAAAAAAIGLVLAASACGDGTKVEVVRLRSANPLTQDLFVRVEGPAGAVKYLSQALTTGAFRKDQSGFFIPPPRHHRTALCSFTHTISAEDVPNLQRWIGKRIRLAVYGETSYAGTFCRALRPAITEHPPRGARRGSGSGTTSRSRSPTRKAQETIARTAGGG
jgi:hypothetical protein